MIMFNKGDMFLSEAEALVNPVNCVGVMGKGLAKKFANTYPKNLQAYKSLCNGIGMHIGDTLVIEEKGKIIVNLPTKKHWRELSNIKFIEKGLKGLVKVLIDKNISSVAIPALGCGNGKMLWEGVRSLMIQHLDKEDLQHIKIFIYEPL